MNVVRVHQIDVFVILPREHGVETVYLARKQRHAFVLNRRTIKGDEFEMQEIGRFE